MKDKIIKKIDELIESGERIFELSELSNGYGIKHIKSFKHSIGGIDHYSLCLCLKKIFIISLSEEDALLIHQYLKSKYDAAELERKKTKEEQDAKIINEYFGLNEEQLEATLAQKAVDFKIKDDEFKFSHIQKETEGGLILATIHRDYMKEIEGQLFSRPRAKEIITDENGEQFFIEEKLVNWTPHILILMHSDNNTKDIDINQTFYCKGEHISKL